MTVDLSMLLTALKTDPAARDAIRREILTEDLLALPARTDARFAEMGTALAQLATRVDQLTVQVAALAVAQASTDERLSQLIAQPAWGDLSRLTGDAYEAYVLRTPRAVAGAVGAAPGTVHPLGVADLDALLDAAESAGHISHEEAEEVGLANRVFVCQGAGTPPVYYVVEASITAKPHDVERAAKRAQLLARTGVDARPVVISDHVAPEAQPDIDAHTVAWRRIPPKRAERTLTR